MSTAEESTPSSSGTPSSAAAWARANSRTLLYVGAALIVVAFLLPWWAVSKYRVSEQRGVNLADPAAREAIVKDLSPEELQEYNSRVLGYEAAWMANRNLNAEFYVASLGKDYDSNLRNQENVTLRSGKLSLHGWSHARGWFGVIFVFVGVGLYFAAQMVPALSPWSWAVPWVWALLAMVYEILVISFYFGVPDRNGDGYAQGISLGTYLALLGGLTALAGAVFEGMRSAEQRLIDLQNAPPAEDEADETPAPLDPEAERRRRLNDW
ncbi:MAG: hypothetical protein JNK76_05680 [Planctomycetales bacterium]|nr:hypothetical protein [Planctomycetales bacterium]MBN8626729.1 hypothetical protein [Planctomycetota bacterium]